MGRRRRVTTTVPKGPSQSSGGPAPFDVDDYLADMGDRIRAERQSRRWTQAELARRSSLQVQTLAYIEHGRTRIYLSSIAQICGALGITVGYLLADDWTMPELPDRNAPRLSRRQAEVFRLAVVEGLTLGQAAAVTGETRQVMGSRLTSAYRSLGVQGIREPQQRRVVALRVAHQHGLIPARRADAG